MKKKILALALALVTLASLSACGKSDKFQKNDDYTIVENNSNSDYGDRDTIEEDTKDLEDIGDFEDTEDIEMSDADRLLDEMFGSPMGDLKAEPKELTLNMSENMEYYNLFTRSSKDNPVKILVPDHNLYKACLGTPKLPTVLDDYRIDYSERDLDYIFDEDIDEAYLFKYNLKLSDSVDGVYISGYALVSINLEDHIYDTEDYAENVVSFNKYTFKEPDRDKKNSDVLHGLITNNFGGSTVTTYGLSMHDDSIETGRATNIAQLVDDDKLLNIRVVIHVSSGATDNDEQLKKVDEYVNSTIDKMEYNIFNMYGMTEELEMVRESDVINP